MSRGVDVLAALDRAIETAALVPDLAESLKQTRAAVAELIEADEELVRVEYGKKFLGRGATNIIGAIKLRHRNALARVRGAA